MYRFVWIIQNLNLIIKVSGIKLFIIFEVLGIVCWRDF